MNTKKKYIFYAWAIFVIIILWFYISNPGFFHPKHLKKLFEFNLPLGLIIFFILWTIRWFTLIPLTPLLLVWILVLPPIPLYIVIISWIITSSSIIYYCWKYLEFDKYFEKRHPKEIKKLKKALLWKELPVIISWAFFPLVPTDVICYVWEVIKIKLSKIVLWVVIWEWIVCALYIWWWESILKFLI